ncbi:hypothetical protein DVH24_031857 [Malus domestica]|uniref:FAD-dependent oxidoreductase 2 FAD binding domain-containing protein n=1 Tax=Malus domestica TaxID=3750 RepID=A0A498J203_MALDO|nr:hypothetical protein DVH24_031857 [Malus domestica]
MSFTLARFTLARSAVRHSRVRSEAAAPAKNNGLLISTPKQKKFTSTAIPTAQNKASEELLVVVGGGAAGVYGAIRAKTLAPNLNVVIIEKGRPLSKVKISGGGRCNVTNGHCVDTMVLAENYPRGHRELKGAFFNTHGPADTMSWFADQGVELKTEDDGRVFPVSNSSSTIIDCLMSELTRLGVSLQTGKAVVTASSTDGGKFLLGVENRTFSCPEYVEADYLLIASGNSKQGYSLASQLGHSIVDPVPSLFTFKIEDPQLRDLSGITFPKVKATLKIENARRNIPQLTQACWNLILDFAPDVHIEDLKSIVTQHKNKFAKHKLSNSYPSEFGLVKRFWIYLLGRQDLHGDTLWASISKNSLISLAHMLKNCNFYVTGKSQYKDEFVTAGGVPLSEVSPSLSPSPFLPFFFTFIGSVILCLAFVKISLNTMESKIQSRLFFAGEVLNVDGITGGFNFQNAWSGGYIAGTSIDGPDEEAVGDVGRPN